MSTLEELWPKFRLPLGAVYCQTISEPEPPFRHRFHVAVGTPFEPPKLTLVASTVIHVVQAGVLTSWVWIMTSWAQLFNQMSKPESMTVVDEVSGVDAKDEYI
jgi:hypothetical protein